MTSTGTLESEQDITVATGFCPFSANSFSSNLLTLLE
jgi:hypothetical protein